ncbi:MAG: Ig-like domain-containing protein [Firmicutes bacterium]|nr:Ig-like domain-containing protein [Candidatus Fiminaster equi]
MKKRILILPLLAMALASCNGGEEQKDQPSIVATITLNKNALSLDPEEKETLVADAKNGQGAVTWSSNNTAIATVDANGLVTAVASGSATITATYSGVTATCVVTVKGVADHYKLAAVYKNANLKDFETNVKDDEDNFRGQTSIVMEVGDDNALVLKPTLSIIDKATFQPVSEDVWTFDYEYKLEKFVDGAYADTSENYGAFDAKKCEFDFNEDAIGKQFRLTVIPGGLSEEQKTKAEYKTIVELKVFDGYNVYTADELAYFHDINIDKRCRLDDTLGENYNANWVSFRKQKGLSETYVAPSIFLQSNIKIRKENVPAEFFWKAEDEAGTPDLLKDGTDVYMHYSRGFTFNGNYFDIDTSEFPVCGNCWEPKDNISHSTLFKVCENANDVDAYPTLKNCTYFGNGPRGLDESRRLGLIFFKVSHATTETNTVIHATFDNFNVSRAVISFYAEYLQSDINLKDCTVSEGYANGVFLYSNGNMNIVNSKLTNFGGPVIVTSGQDETKVGFHVNVDNNSVLENYVDGEEPWFINTGAAAAMPLFKSADASFLNKVGKTMIKNQDGNQLINVILVNYGLCPYVKCQIGSSGSPMGIDKNDGDKATTYVSDLYGGKTKFLSENGGEVTLEGETIVGGDPTPFAGANFFDILQFNEAFGFVSFITGLSAYIPE